MRILLFTDTLGFGGKERRLLELIKYLKQNTDYTIALVLTENEIYYEYVYELGIQIEIMERKFSRFDPSPLLKLIRFCKVFKPDVIHAWGIMTTFYAIPAKLMIRKPLISSMIADVQGLTELFSSKTIFYKIDYLFSDLLLSNSNAGLKAYKVAEKKSRVIRNGVYAQRFLNNYNSSLTRSELGINTEFMVVMVGSFWIYKDYDLFVDAAKEVAKKRSDVTFVGVGDGIFFDRIRQRIVNEQVSNVVLTGRRKDVEKIVSASDIGLLCTVSEGISNAIIEYMALGKPVVVTDTEGGSNEIVVDGETGFCTERKLLSVVPLINRLLDDEELRTRMGQKGKERIATHFSIERMGSEFVDVYQDITSNN